tara:strand:- start:742 stop:996 length:255 start_codon:yes stop_codon:yes gene_type:complete
MKQYLTEKNLMWAAIALLAAMALSSCTSECCGDVASARKGARQRLDMAKEGMRGRMQGKRRGSRGDKGEGVWVTREALTETETE